MLSPKYSEFSWNYNRSITLYLSTMQHLVEQAFKELATKYHLVHPLLYSHNFILQCLYYHKASMSLAEISRESGQALPNVSVAAKLLQANDLIICMPDPHDKRKYTVVLSPLGMELCDDYVANYLKPLRDKLFKDVSPEAFNGMYQFFDQVEQNIHRFYFGL